MVENVQRIAEVLQRAEDMLATARQGLADVLNQDRRRRDSGVHNAIVFGRTVSFVIQNLSSIADGFKEWYEPEQDAMRADPVTRFMVEARNEILKRGEINVERSILISRLSFKDLPFDQRPPGAVGFLSATSWGALAGRSACPTEASKSFTSRYLLKSRLGSILPTCLLINSQSFADCRSKRY